MDTDGENPDYELDISPENLCRICLAQDQAVKTIFCSEIVDGNIVNFPAVIESVLDIRIAQENHLPEKICTNCRKKVRDFYIFKKKSQQNDRLLNRLFGQETQEAENDDQREEFEEVKSKEDVEEDVVESLPECQNCGVIFASNEDFLEHKLSCSVLIQCFYCSELFPDEVNVKQHIEEAHREHIPDDAEVEVTVDEIKDEMNEIQTEEAEAADNIASLEGLWHCSLCQLKFSSVEQFQQHEAFHRKTFPSVLSNIPMYKCAICCVIFLEVTQLHEHFEANECISLQISHENVTYMETKFLNGCNEDDQDCGNLRKLSSIERQRNLKLRCDYCGASFTNFPAILQHSSSVHTDDAEIDEVLHQCGICLDVMSNQRSTREHLYLNHCKSFDCFISNCDKSYQTSSKLFQHQFRFHSESQVMQCTHCSATLHSNTDFTHHLRNECPGRKYKCSMCSKKFLTIQGKKQHELIHQQDKQFECSLCSKRFISRIELIVHNRLHSGEKPYSCSLCPKTFRTLSNKKDHMSTHISERNYRCEVCKSFFKSERTLKGHEKIHTDSVKTHKCSQCAKMFRRKQHLLAHMKLHVKK
ncbi:zinc finger protein 197-like [Phlebotomus argentipes]|uniref:zinc finger protein 197-like n=1 Tax=Phlebotomus argentipes TaxID=94469 RepID=UPI002892A4E1|nr:zinc finger protein 197-like [Phlebotomus argentipes]